MQLVYLVGSVVSFPSAASKQRVMNHSVGLPFTVIQDCASWTTSLMITRHLYLFGHIETQTEQAVDGLQTSVNRVNRHEFIDTQERAIEPLVLDYVMNYTASGVSSQAIRGTSEVFRHNPSRGIRDTSLRLYKAPLRLVSLRR